ncbi:MAG: transposase [Lewinellaceae bacterium]|nr:transposase [Lewinellaceae bacterium]
MTYLHNEWPKLKTIFLDGRLLVDNNFIENIIHPLALGRNTELELNDKLLNRIKEVTKMTAAPARRIKIMSLPFSMLLSIELNYRDLFRLLCQVFSLKIFDNLKYFHCHLLKH